MHKSTPSPSAAVRSINNDCVASRSNTIKQTAAQAHTIDCVRAGCAVVDVHGVGTDWCTVNCLIDDHALIWKGRLRKPANPPPQSDAHSAKIAPRPPRIAPASRGAQGNNSNNRGKGTRGPRGKYQKEPERKQGLEEDEYAEDIQPKSVKCRVCKQILKCDNRSRYYPGLWIKHRRTCRAIRKMEAAKKLARERELGWIEASGDGSDGFEYHPPQMVGFSTSYVRGDWGGGER
ncbi:hypothetical protein CY34DRAFT_15991 [Suillus luteus UH-Slu-Lm8-n1]|uniref:Uncharacterized protein n=1 Tax=Suillus luteus UH-Slu-Lm8-n1 TaxID=930992 RepID=A0A0D0AS20_9AGAM|nr:hypothetical protein CY34DRAFT_15991 [Suillus luteus UH-Slu-Lm8-n1]